MIYPKIPQLIERVKFKGYEGAELYLSRFVEANLPVLFIGNKETEQVYIICNINPDGNYNLNEFEFAIKNYSENEGVLEWLINNEYLKKSHNSYSSGYAVIYLCYATDKLKQYIKELSK